MINRRERIQADREKKKSHENFTQAIIYLVFYDENTNGSFCDLKTDKRRGSFLSNDSDVAAPPWTTLRTLEEASRNYEIDEDFLNDKWLKQLIKPGSSLGGARPKANIEAPDAVFG